MTRRFPLYEVKRRHNLGDPVYWNFRLEDLDIRIHANETALMDLSKVGENITQLGLDRLDNGLTPIIVEALDRLQGILETFGAGSVTSLAIGTGTKVFVIEEGERNSFISGAFVYAQKTDDPTKFMFGRTVEYDPDTGELTLDVSFTGGAGTVADWRVSMSGPRGPQGQVGEAEGASQIGITPIDGLDAEDVQEALEEINGDLVAHIAATTAALAGKAASVHSHAQSDITGLTTALADKAAAVDLASAIAAIATKAPINNPTFTGLITVPAYTAGQNTATISASDNHDYAPTGWTTESTIVINGGSTDHNITGFAAPTTGGNRKRIVNGSSGLSTFLLMHENTGSSASNRIIVPGSFSEKEYILQPGECVDLEYIGGSVNRWLIVGRQNSWNFRQATADVSLTNDATLNDDTELYFPAYPGRAYAFEAIVWLAGQPGNLSINGPAQVAFHYSIHSGFNSGVGGGLVKDNTANTVIDVSAYNTGFGLTGNGIGIIKGTVEISGAASPGNFTVRWCQASPSGTATIRRRGSYLQWRRVW